MGDYSHLQEGEAQMVDIRDKKISSRAALSSACVDTGSIVLESELSPAAQKELIATIRIAAIQAVKRTAELIPLCHPITLRKIECKVFLKSHVITIHCEVQSEDKTGVEMESLVGSSIGALTAYDMIKSRCPEARITEVALQYKSGGKTGVWQRNPSQS